MILHLFVSIWNTIPDEIRIAHYDLGILILRLLFARCTYYEDASIAC